MTRGLAWKLQLLTLMLGAIGGCRSPSDSISPPGSEGRSPSARMEIVEALRQDLEAPRHPADGGGVARFAAEPEPVIAGHPGRWTFVYQAGPEGIAPGGWLFFQAPPFWGWTTPQVQMPEALGYTEVECQVEGVSLHPMTIDQQLLGIEIQGESLAAGEEIRVVYGAGPRGAIADTYAESRSCFYFAVDGDGDGIRSLVGNPLCVEVAPGPATRMVMTMPSTARPGDRVELTVAMLDAVGNRASDWAGPVTLEGPTELGLPSELLFQKDDAGAQKVAVEVHSPGLFEITGVATEGLIAKTNPIKVEVDIERVLWADLHGHSALTDGTGTPKDYFRYARDVAALDVAALTDHDHWGMQPLAIHPELWEEIRRETELFHRPGNFVTLLGYEWTSWIHGHRHVLYFSGHGQIFSSVDPSFESPVQLWDALRQSDVLTFAHHSAGGPVATNWQIPPDPELEPITEIVSVHGSSEAPDSPAVIFSPVAGNFVRDVLDKGYPLGFVGSGDSHDGHPGLSHLNAPSGGLAAILSEDLSRAAVKEALLARRVYATNGPRILLRVELEGYPTGATVELRSLEERGIGNPTLQIEAIGPGAMGRLDLVRSGEVVESVACADRAACSASLQITDLRPGEYLYVRVEQTDGGAAWSSPFFFR